MKTFNQLTKKQKMALCEAAIDGKDIESHNQYTKENKGWTKMLRVGGMVKFYGQDTYRIAK